MAPDGVSLHTAAGSAPPQRGRLRRGRQSLAPNAGQQQHAKNCPPPADLLKQLRSAGVMLVVVLHQVA